MISRQRAKDLPFSTLRFLRISRAEDPPPPQDPGPVPDAAAGGGAAVDRPGPVPADGDQPPALFGGAATAVAVILDNSASMGMIDQGKRAVRDRPRRHPARSSTASTSEDQVALWVTGGPKLPGQAKLEATQDNARQILNQVNVSYMRADLAAKIADARRVLLKSDARQQDDLRGHRSATPLMGRAPRQRVCRERPPWRSGQSQSRRAALRGREEDPRHTGGDHRLQPHAQAQRGGHQGRGSRPRSPWPGCP